MQTLVASVGYVLYLCVASSSTCYVARHDVITPQGVWHEPWTFGKQRGCLTAAEQLSNATPDSEGHYFLVTPEIWYECREEKTEDIAKIPRTQGTEK